MRPKPRPPKPREATIPASMENRLYKAVRALHDAAWDELKLVVEARIAQAMGSMTLKAGKYGVTDHDMTAHLDPKVKRFIVAIDGEIEAGGLKARVGLRQKDAGEWDIRSTAIYDQIRTHVIKLAESTLADIKASTLEETQRVISEIQGEVLAGQQAGENMRDRVKRIERFFGEESRWKARRIATTEASRAANWGYLAATADADWIVGYEWLLSADACPQCKAVGTVANGQPRRVKKGSPFATGQSKDPFYATIQAPPLHPGCRCTLTGIIEDDAPREWDEAVAGNPDGSTDTSRVKTSVAIPKDRQLPLPLPSPMIVDPAAELEKALELFGETTPGRPGEPIPPKKRNAS